MQKRRYRQYEARTARLPASYHAAVVGEDPVEFTEDFLRNYPGGPWFNRERERLTDALVRAAGGES